MPATRSERHSLARAANAALLFTLEVADVRTALAIAAAARLGVIRPRQTFAAVPRDAAARQFAARD
ncbi:MAG: hypothetical protein JOZ46_12545 [Candidatus Dormibacteraeota bacterium]|nr:hypothetical protein [Candidatus Dormibacteraeota bacterium]MBV9526630.1 hypothetical protein [Candidatus Dormibacteraeota bacterium]